MSYIKKIGDKEYEFASEKAYDTYLKLATSAAKQNGITRREAFEGNYQKYVDANSPLIGAKKEETVQPVSPAQTVVPQYSDYSGLLDYADAYKSSAYANASALRGASYEAALKARQEAEALAEIQRKRGIVDASTMAEQQKATYGANAEQLGRMGLNVSGYSDYLNSQAYASGMAARQNANAQATDIKRQATYQEALARLEADKVYSQATAEADKTYYGAMKEIEAAKIADAKALEERLYKEQQQKEAQQQTNYQNFMKLAIENGFTADQITALAPSYGISTEDAIKVADTNKALYGENAATEPTTESGPTEAFDNVFYDISGEGDNATVEVKTESEAKVAYNEAKKRYEAGEIPEDEWRTIEATYEMEYGNGNIVSIYSKTYDENSFGKFNKGDEQKDLISAIRLMVEGKLMTSNGQPLEEGDVVPVNFGSGTQQYWVYKGNGKFEKTSAYKMDVEGIRKVVVPEGFVAVEKGTNVRDWKIKKK